MSLAAIIASFRQHAASAALILTCRRRCQARTTSTEANRLTAEALRKLNATGARARKVARRNSWSHKQEEPAREVDTDLLKRAGLLVDQIVSPRRPLELKQDLCMPTTGKKAEDNDDIVYPTQTTIRSDLVVPVSDFDSESDADGCGESDDDASSEISAMSTQAFVCFSAAPLKYNGRTERRSSTWC
eukprot:TRINITY_DN45732_c0_g1_i1.p1 TRINITY_DN45732_c0_g1~~TRINITY_DN45732_c0_g1_i1.p1  ORF type:complete len:187 (-),score=34.97 TRINITY_DN45732_c0_g1_i1:223-783(-)